MEADFVVIGSGSAGSALAFRLSEDGRHSVIVIEHGGSDYGPFIAAGPILSALGCMGLGATIGGIAGALVGYGIPEFEAKRYEGKVVGGGILVSVHVGGRSARQQAYEVFARHDAEDISIAEEARADFPVPHARSA